MKNVALIVLSLVALTATADAASAKGDRPVGKVGATSVYTVVAPGKPAGFLLVGRGTPRALSAQDAADRAAPGKYANVTPGDGSGRGLPTLTASGIRVSANGLNHVVVVSGGKFAVRRDPATARPATHHEVQEAAYYRWLNTGNSDATANWLASEAQMRDGR